MTNWICLKELKNKKVNEIPSTRFPEQTKKYVYIYIYIYDERIERSSSNTHETTAPGWECMSTRYRMVCTPSFDIPYIPGPPGNRTPNARKQRMDMLILLGETDTWVPVGSFPSGSARLGVWPPNGGKARVPAPQGWGQQSYTCMSCHAMQADSRW